MYCIDLQPFSIVEREEIKKYVKFYDPKINFPSCYTVYSTALNDVYYNHVKSILKTSKLGNLLQNLDCKIRNCAQ
ncbi:hypothetical protein DOY81_008096 [Sarcophaga bullata]|nr:hypothetical protein DOY81_008096 [Sarcophaga bullata]